MSVAIAVYNVAPYLEAALESVRAQSFADFEIVAIDDGSTDGGGEILAAWRDPRLRVCRQENRGVAAARNRLLAMARGDYVAVFDGDDVMLPDRIARQVAYLDGHPECVIVGGQLVEMTEDGQVLSAVHGYPTGPEAVRVKADSGSGAAVPHGGSMYRLEAARAIGGYDPAFAAIGEDLDFIRRILERGDGANLSEPVLRYRLRRGSACTLRRREAAAVRSEMRRRGADKPARKVAPASASPGSARAEAAYLCRVGRAALRGGHYRLARNFYCQSIAAFPLQALAYTGVLRALLRQGAGPVQTPPTESIPVRQRARSGSHG